MDSFDEYLWEQELRDSRLKDQKDKRDYSYGEDGEIEKCECGAKINSRGHCPRCDY
jgi:hypothetical protein